MARDGGDQQNLDDFLERLRLALEHRGMSQSGLARQLGVRAATVSDWFNRGAAPSGLVMLRLPDVLGVHAGWLFSGEGSMTASRAEEGAA